MHSHFLLLHYLYPSSQNRSLKYLSPESGRIVTNTACSFFPQRPRHLQPANFSSTGCAPARQPSPPPQPQDHARRPSARATEPPLTAPPLVNIQNDRDCR